MSRRAPLGRAGRVCVKVATLSALALVAAGCGSGAPKDAAQTASAQKGKPVLREPAPARKGVDGRYAPPSLDPPAKPGQVLVEDGPFVERLTFKQLSLRTGDRPEASGALMTGVEDSELLAIELEVDFYDGKGNLVGKGTREYGPGPSLSGEAQRFAVRSDKPAPSAVSALLTVVNFVND